MLIRKQVPQPSTEVTSLSRSKTCAVEAVRPFQRRGTLKHSIPGGLYLLTAVVMGLSICPANAQSPPDRPVGQVKEPQQAKQPDDLSRRLLRKAMQEGAEGVMETILRLMGESATKIEVDFDPGEQTQEIQREILVKLDEAIHAAAMNRRRSKSQPPSGSSDKRRRATPQGQSAESKAQEDQAVADGSARDSREGPPNGDAESPNGEFADPDALRGRAWGNLPARERDELIQGAAEGYLDRYRVWVERYYRALQDSGSPKPR